MLGLSYFSLVLLMRLLLLERDPKLKNGAQTSELRTIPRFLNFPAFRNCPGLSTFATQFLRYRIRGIKVKYTIYPKQTDPATHEPVFFL